MKVAIRAPYTRSDVTYAAVRLADSLRLSGREVRYWTDTPNRRPVDPYWDGRVRYIPDRVVPTIQSSVDAVAWLSMPPAGVISESHRLRHEPGGRHVLIVDGQSASDIDLEHVEYAHAVAFLDYAWDAGLVPDWAAEHAISLPWAPATPAHSAATGDLPLLALGRGPDRVELETTLVSRARALASSLGGCLVAAERLSHVARVRLLRATRKGLAIKIICTALDKWLDVLQSTGTIRIFGEPMPFGTLAWEALASGLDVTADEPGSLRLLPAAHVLGSFVWRGRDLARDLDARRRLFEERLDFLFS